MIQVTCGACGAVQELADADVPPGGKSITCASCKSRIAVPGAKPTAASAALPDLPAPRRPSPLAGAGPAKPAPRSALSSVEDLPTPRQGKPAMPELSAPPTPSPSVASRMSDTADLPAPKRQIPAIPPPMVSSASVPDLVAPKRAPTPPVRQPPAIPPIGKATVSGIAPGPKPPAATGPGEIDLDDLLAPAARSGMSDLPAPRRAVGEPDLPAPKRPSDVADLPTPKRPGEIADLPQPASAAAQARHQAGSTDLPAPKGFFDDLPQPARNQGGSTDLPAPKGFFDDLPQPARTQNATGLPAPKGFFDDIPQVAKHQSGPMTPVPAPSAASRPVPAPSAAARPVPAPSAAARPMPSPSMPAPSAGRPADPGRMHSPSAPPPTADDLFNDLTPPPVMTAPPALDLDDLDLGPPGDAAAGAPRARSPSTSGARGSQPGPSKSQTIPPPSGTRSTEDSDVDGQALPMLDLGDGPAERGDFGGVDLPKSTPIAPAQGPTGVSFKASRPGGNHEPMALSANAADLTLDVEDTKKKVPERRKRRTSLKQGKAAATPTSRRRTRVVLLVVLLLAGLGAGGFYLWRRHQKQQAAAADLKDKMQGARAAMIAGDAPHWGRAQTLANQVFTANPTNAEAAGIAATAAFASVFDDGVNAEQRAKTGAALINLALGKALSGPDLDKAQGLKLVNDGQAQRGLEKYLEPAAKRAPADGNAALFLGWGRLAAGDHAGAIEAFDRSAKALPKRDLPALLGRARAKLAMGDLVGARADFTLVLERDKAHVGAQVGLAASATTPAEISQREKDLAALLRTKDIDKADPRALAQAYTLLGDDARRGNRFDSARESYRKAAVKAPLETAPLRGLAELEMVEGKLDAAAETIEKGLALAPSSIDLHLVAGEIELRRGKLADAEARIAKIKELKPATPSDKARLFLLIGRWHEANNRLDDALAAYEDAIATADPNDVAPPLAAATLLGKMAAADPLKAADLRARATKLLAPMETKAGSDPGIAIALGIGYLAAGESAKAEFWLRHAIAAKPDDIDAHFQLAEALTAQGKRDDALAILRKAFELDPTRLDVGLQLARRYEDAGRVDDASAMYDKLLAGKDLTLDLRARAGRFYERMNKIDKAREQGDEILKVDPKHPAGLFLKGVGLLAEGKLEPARRALQEATDADKDAQYLDALGRANEALGKAGDPRGKDDALRAYAAATAADPTMVNPLAGLGRIQVERRQGDKALEPLLAANKLSPNDPDIQYNIGLAYQLIQKGPEAIAWMTKSLAIKPRADGFYNVGNMYYEAENFRMAAPALTRATELGASLERSSGTTIDWMVEAYFRLGSAEKDLHHGPAARKAWQAFIDRNPKDQVKVDKIKIEMLGLPR